MRSAGWNWCPWAQNPERIEGRLASLDAPRGCTVAAMLLVNDPGDWDHVYVPLDHSKWNGCTPTDLVFPFFVFVVGVSVALAVLPRLEQGALPSTLTCASLWRALRILGLGVAIDDTAGCPVYPVAGLRCGFRRDVVTDRLRDGSAPRLSQALIPLAVQLA
jgi:uncharacterized membrane protein